MTSMLWSNPLDPGEERIANTAEEILSKSNMAVRPVDGKIAGIHKSSSANTPWIHFNHTTARHCGIWNQIYTRAYNHIPSFCRSKCWKTVIKPRTVKELFELHDLMQALNFPSKCGIDVRDYTPGPYAAFVYGDSLKEGQEYCRQMKEQVAKISPDIPVFLKRGCTEMEVIKPSDQWEFPMSEADVKLERKLDDIFVKEETDGKQAFWLRNHIMRKWLRHAMSIGDVTWKELCGDVEGMHPHVVHYEDKEAFEKTKTMESPMIGQEV